ncbi:MAG TPA: hypothetical protein VGW58_17390 [Pyrinomonadaceae bacterium]|nr:hypothetical protein [Pyrinomonadaceae bacterium]
MKSTICASIFLLVLVSLALPSLSFAGADGPSATGSFQFDLNDGQPKFLNFNARVQNNGRTVGEMTFTDPNVSVVADPDAPQNPNAPATGASIRATFDCLKITGNRAVMGGVIVESNVLTAIGLRVLLVVEDNGEGVNAPGLDKLTWGVYQNPASGWTPKDSERDDDNGAFLTWIATDAERPDDVGIPSNQNKTIGCESFPVSSYSFVDIAHGGGNVQVQP